MSHRGARRAPPAPEAGDHRRRRHRRPGGRVRAPAPGPRAARARGAAPRRRPRLHAARLGARPVHRGRRHAHPPRPRPHPRVLPAVRPGAPAVRHGEPQGVRLRRGRAHDDGRGRPEPRAAAVRARGARAGPHLQRDVERGHAGGPRALRARGHDAFAKILERVRPVLDPRVPPDARVLRGRDRAVRRDVVPRAEHERRRHRAAPRDRRRGRSRTCRRSSAGPTCCRGRSTSR